MELAERSFIVYVYGTTVRSSARIETSYSKSMDEYVKMFVRKYRCIAESSNLSNIEHRAVIKYFVKKEKRLKIFEDMVSVLQESAPAYTMVKNGSLFQQGREAVKMILAQGVL
ncbi:hypothetical protein EVAR_18092_1 [Eumeta japonica]|uniref:Uncharacterized protein n=1 Tax=Eumeta variegata TaxID=151549 RepID=A0A4C1VHT7_EUMVA|nr:hypothetical protein EVAR_18092_1 [Eumeta japonica]